MESHEAFAVAKYKSLYERAGAVGLTLLENNNRFEIKDAPKADGVVTFSALAEVERFIRGYELGYAAGH